MATPRPDTYSVASGAGVYAGIFGTPANQLVLVGPTSGLERCIAPSYFTVTHTGTLTASVKVVPSDGAGGQFWPLEYSADKSVTLSPSKSSAVFFYAPASSGAKTITLTNDGGLGNGSGIAFAASAYTAPSATPFRLTRGGATIGSYATLQRCKDVGGYQSGDVIKVTGGTYVVYDVADPGNLGMTNNPGGVQMGVELDTLTIEWETPGQPMVLDQSRNFMVSMWTGGQPQALTMGSTCRNLTLRGVHIRGARPPIGTLWLGAAVWSKLSGADGAANLTVEYCKFSELPDGVKTQDGRYDLSTYIRYCVFENNSDGKGLDHDVYTGRNALTYVLGCTFRKTSATPYPQNGMGHFIKSRCRQTVVRGCLLDGWMSAAGIGGVAQSINTPNGGVVEIVGNVILHYGAKSVGGKGEPLRYGDDQHTQTVDTNLDPSLTTHSLLFAQNTVRQVLGRAPDGNAVDVVKIYPTGVATTLLSGALAQIPVVATVRNNIAANDTTGASTFLTRYPDNTIVSGSTISDTGQYSGGQIAGSPAVNDAPSEWVGDFTAPASRVDSNRGGRTESIPAWVPSTPWQWTDIPSSTWINYMKSDGSGIAPDTRQSTGDAGPNWSYTAQWEYSGPVYSRKNHEIWWFGGGHAATTNNIVVKWRLNQSSPDMAVVSMPTPVSIRNDYLQNETWRTTMYLADGKPAAPHSYYNSVYSDDADEFISFGVAGTATGYPIASAVNSGSRDVAGLPRATGIWRPEKYYADVTMTLGVRRGPRLMSDDGKTIYYWDGPDAEPAVQLRKFVIATNTHSIVGSSTIPFYSLQADPGTGVAMVMGGADSSTGWQAKFVTLATGATIDVTVSGDSLPAGLFCQDITWCAARGYYVALWVNGSAALGGSGSVTTALVATITPTGANTAVASVKTMTGSPVTKVPFFRGIFYDPLFDAVVVVGGHSTPLKIFKVA